MKPGRQTKIGIAALRFSPVNGHECPAGSVAEWAGKINTLWGRGTVSTLELAKVVCVARSKLRYGAWTQLWKSGGVRFSKRKGDMLVTIGKQLTELDEQISAHLPAGWDILYHVSLLELPAIKQHTMAGTIHPGLTLREAKCLLAEFRRQPDRNKSPKISVRQRVQKLTQFIHTTLNAWSAAERRLAAQRLSKLSREIAGLDQPSGVLNSTINSFRISPRVQLVSVS